MSTNIEKLSPNEKRTIAAYSTSALLLLLIATSMGVLSALYYTFHFNFLTHLGLSFQKLRPLHTSAGLGWIFLSGTGFVNIYLFLNKKVTRKAGRLLLFSKLTFFFWLTAGAYTFFQLLRGIFTGREYIVFQPIASFFILIGWIFFAYNFLKEKQSKFSQQPVYVWMWMVAIFLFIYTFIESHAYMLPFFTKYPIRDMAIQWKSYGMLVGSFNLIMYGGLIYLHEVVSNDKIYAKSNLAFSLFFLGLINSFTNFGHHTYHLPQNSWVKWISFVVSMLEIIIFFKIAWDLFGLKTVLRLRQKYPVAAPLLCAVTLWTFLQLIMSILISIPPLNSITHGTLFIAAHAMGTMVGIDTMALLAIMAYIYQSCFPKAYDSKNSWYLTLPIGLLNLGLLILWITLLYGGYLSSKYILTTGKVFSSLLLTENFGFAFVSGGIILTLGCFWLIVPWIIGWIKLYRKPL